MGEGGSRGEGCGHTEEGRAGRREGRGKKEAPEEGGKGQEGSDGLRTEERERMRERETISHTVSHAALVHVWRGREGGQIAPRSMLVGMNELHVTFLPFLPFPSLPFLPSLQPAWRPPFIFPLPPTPPQPSPLLPSSPCRFGGRPWRERRDHRRADPLATLSPEYSGLLRASLLKAER